MEAGLPPSLLTPTRLRILWALLKYPEASDGEIAEITRTKPSTVYTVKRTLRYHQIFDETYIPCLDFLGIEFVSVHLLPSSNYSRRREVEALRNIVESLPHAVYSLRMDSYTSIISLHRDFQQFTYYRTLLKEALLKSDLWNIQTLQELIFPLNSSELMAYFTFHRALERSIRGLPESENHQEKRECSLKIEELSWNDCLVLLGILRFPTLKDSHISSLLKISRQRVARVRAHLWEGGALRKRRVLNIWRLPADVVFMAGGTHLPRSEVERDLERRFLAVLKDLSLFFAVNTPFSTFLLGSLDSSEEMEETRDIFVSLWNSLYTNDDSFSLITTSPPNIIVFRNLDYFPLVEEIVREIFFYR
ncbi:MAG: helix-turn-helix transcriptional regulator [Thermoplasmata archaeon]|nr:helix-turn-helix transcriptional regulator [Thermoplasmata archaeon]